MNFNYLHVVHFWWTIQPHSILFFFVNTCAKIRWSCASPDVESLPNTNTTPNSLGEFGCWNFDSKNPISISIALINDEYRNHHRIYNSDHWKMRAYCWEMSEQFLFAGKKKKKELEMAMTHDSPSPFWLLDAIVWDCYAWNCSHLDKADSKRQFITYGWEKR